MTTGGTDEPKVVTTLREIEIALFGKPSHSALARAAEIDERSFYYWMDPREKGKRYGKVSHDALTRIDEMLATRVNELRAQREKLKVLIKDAKAEEARAAKPA